MYISSTVFVSTRSL